MNKSSIFVKQFKLNNMGMNKAEEKEIDFIKRRFVTADNLIVFDEQFEGYLNTILNKCRQSEIDELTNEVERLRKESEWISIKDELPIIGKGFKHFSDDVLCLLIDESCTVTFYDYELKKWNLRPHSYEVTHWKPLPPINQ